MRRGIICLAALGNYEYRTRAQSQGGTLQMWKGVITTVWLYISVSSVESLLYQHNYTSKKLFVQGCICLYD